ncbi:hypothetical protein H310_07788 [Aphanomyces invadans]|uniref:WRKY19-like zinc finger domain-containing protein n=1 Tax=Aphanomyces invadans TaxID=157072 RepID=A0A024TZY2_9STRA|nr:hypothetical protein H310_07788 [Aphanomyces invadans]ETV99730.1 hypothetical protein H310_07788 [Aphanomyces invadans]|eukprot:XP_008871506.1 hypothetical protein H310_07788 [Aphanomyces invadans]
MAALDALAEDSEIVELLSTLFNNEYMQGANGGAAAATNERDPSVGAQPPALPAPSTTRRKLCKEEGCMRKNVSKGFCIRHGVRTILVIAKAADEFDAGGKAVPSGVVRQRG